MREVAMDTVKNSEAEDYDPQDPSVSLAHIMPMFVAGPWWPSEDGHFEHVGTHVPFS
jgi:hypothetical protein